MRLNRCGHPDSVVDQQMVRIITGCGVLAVLALGVLGCSSTRNLGIVTKTSANPAAFIESEGEYEELGLKEGVPRQLNWVQMMTYTPTSFGVYSVRWGRA